MYLALYRKYRPQTFDDVVSQPHITTTLKNQITGHKHGHAYLFTGSRGTGKTTCAKILAMAVNCLSPKDGNPCLGCEACREIMSGSAVDITEMDAASNNGVNDVRILRDEVQYTPVSCKYRVYIIDEVHMMSAAAFNALLKTLEEPPAHVVFILATTELHKVPATIVSRCQRFEFRRIEISDSADRLMQVAQNEGIALQRDAAELISRLSDGGMRDALSILDRCITSEGDVTCEIVRSCAGVADNRHLFAFAEMIAAGDMSGCLNLLQQLYSRSMDLSRLVDELSGHYRDLMLYKTVPEDKALIGAAPDEYDELARICGMYSLEDILRCLELLQKCADSIGKTRHRRTAVEMALIRMCMKSPADSGEPVRTAAEAKKPVSQPMGQEFAPLPDEKLSPQVAAIINKTKALSEERAGAASKPQTTPAADAPLPPPVPDSVPAVQEEFSVPLPDAPPEEYIPPREFEQPLQPASPAPADEQTAENTKAEPLVPKAEKLSEITPEYWKSCVQLTEGMLSFMLDDATARVNEDGVLEICSDNLLLLNQIKEHGYGELESQLSRIMGKSVRAIVVSKTREEPEEQSITTPNVNKLLEKARRLGIDVEIKN